jgi:hypothetical protein
MVAVNVFRINTVVYTVVARRIEYVLERRVHFIDELGMYPKLIQRLQRGNG